MDQLIVNQGGHQSAAAVKGSINIGNSCLAKGPGWIRVNKSSKRIEYRHVEEETIDDDIEQWTVRA
eukprot:6740200-Pyramimonas_sp.AAC.1